MFTRLIPSLGWPMCFSSPRIMSSSPCPWLFRPFRSLPSWDFLPEFGFDLNDGIVIVNNICHAVRVRVDYGVKATPRCLMVPTPFGQLPVIHFGTRLRKRKIAPGAGDNVLERWTPPRIWSGFGNFELLTTTASVCLSLECLRRYELLASMAVGYSRKLHLAPPSLRDRLLDVFQFPVIPTPSPCDPD